MHTAHTMLEAFTLGQFRRAIEHFEHLAPEVQEHPLLLEIAANLYGELALPEREAAAWRVLVERCPDDERIGCAYASLLMRKGAVVEAVQRLEDHVGSTVESLVLLARGYLRLRRYRDAIELLASIRPHADPVGPVMVLEAQARYASDDRAAARDLLEQVADTDPRDGATTRALAHAWRQMGAVQQAIFWFERAVAADPGDRESWEDLASCFEQVGALDRARRMVASVVERFGPTVGTRRLDLRLLRRAGHLAEARAVGEALLEEPIPLAVRRSTLLELARVAQQAGDPERCFDRAVAGNLLARDELAALGFPAGVFGGGVARVRDQAHRRFPAAPPRRSRRPAPVFLVGVPRSGTTLTQQILQSHPELVGLDETDPATRALRRYCLDRPELAALDYPDRIAHLAGEDWHALRELYWDEVAADGIDLSRLDEGARLLDKLPLSLVRLQWLGRLFPDAHAVVCLRDPRDTTWSNFLQDYPPNLFAAESTDLVRMAETVASALEVWLAWRDDPPIRAVEVRYEHLVADPRGTLSPVFAALGLRRAPGGRIDGVVRDVSSPLHGHARERWRGLEAWLAPVLPRLDPVATALGYPSALTPDAV